MTARTTFKRTPERGSHDREVINAILDAANLAHVGFAVDGQVFVVPTLFGRDNDSLYLHGSAVSRTLRHLQGVPACVTVTLVDGLVLARSAFHHSANYRSVMAFGKAHHIDDPAKKLHALRALSDHVLPTRWDQVRAPNQNELRATSVLEFLIEDASAKIRTGPPIDDEADLAIQVWAGVIPPPQHPKDAAWPDIRSGHANGAS